MISNTPSTWPAGDLVWNVCRAIAFAEGADVPNTAPDRYNNPGDLSKGDEHGQAVLGYVRLPDGEQLIHFASKEAGWRALYEKIRNIVNGTSSSYSPRWTWTKIAQTYAGNWRAWVNNVTRSLGVQPKDIFANYFAAGGVSPGPAPGLPRRATSSAGHKHHRKS